MHRPLRKALTACSLLIPASPALAQYPAADSGDTGWMMACGILTLLGAIPGIALAYGAQSPARAVALVIGGTAGVSVVFAMIGYSLAYGPGSLWLGGTGNAFLTDLAPLRDGLTAPESAFVLQQMALAIIAPCLIATAVAAKARFAWFIIFAPLWSLVVSMPIMRSIWGAGWLSRLGVVDYSGALVINVSAGVAALIAALVLGRLASGPPSTGETDENAAGRLAGAGLFWVGCLAMAGGWALAATDDAATAVLNAHLAASAAALGWPLMERLTSGKASPSSFAYGALSGLAGISASAGLTGAVGAISTGLACGLLCPLGANAARRLLHADTPALIFSIHALGGTLGALMLPPLMTGPMGGVGLAPGTSVPTLLVAQFIGVAIVCLWSALGTAIAGLSLSIFIPLRSAEGKLDARSPQRIFIPD